MITPQLVTPAEAAKLLATSVRALDHRRRNGEIGFIRIGRLVRYSLADIQKYIAENTVRLAPRRRGRPRVVRMPRTTEVKHA